MIIVWNQCLHWTMCPSKTKLIIVGTNKYIPSGAPFSFYGSFGGSSVALALPHICPHDSGVTHEPVSTSVSGRSKLWNDPIRLSQPPLSFLNSCNNMLSFRNSYIFISKFLPWYMVQGFQRNKLLWNIKDHKYLCYYHKDTEQNSKDGIIYFQGLWYWHDHF